MIIDVDTVKGFRDYLPPESLKRQEVRKIIEGWFRKYGFLPVETPIVEFDELMKSDNLTGEDEAISDRFRLKDRGGRNLGLRYEFTFQLARIFRNNPNIKLPFKRYQIGENFRDEPIGPGRFRQFTQCDVDCIGDPTPMAEAELLSLTTDILKELGIKAEIEVNNRKLLYSLIESVEISDIAGVMRELDKISKIGEDQVKTNLRKFADANQILTLFKLMEKDIKFFIENAFDGANELETLSDACKSQGVQIKINPFMIRGFSYYTGNIFEVIGPDKLTVAAGGRYDKVVGKYLGREISSVGISFGLERMSDITSLVIPPAIPVLLLSIEEDDEMFKLARKMRKEGISCMTFSDKPGKGLEYANSLGIPSVVFIGENEIEKKKFKIRDMLTGKEKELTEKQLISSLSKN